MSTLKFKVSFKVEKTNMRPTPDLLTGKYKIIMKYENENNTDPILNGQKLFSTQGSYQTDIDYLTKELSIAKSKASIVNFVRADVVMKMTDAGMFDEDTPEALELIKQIEAITYEDLEVII